jgi:type IV fimbrial biogenesis protein FimT
MSRSRPLARRESAVHPPKWAFRRPVTCLASRLDSIAAMKNRALGLTLIELMVAILILAILMTAAVPGFRSITDSSRTSAATNDLVTALNLARSEALRRATPTVVCASADQASCSGSNTWTPGWIVFTDMNGDGDMGAGDVLLQTWRGPQGQMEVTGTASRATYNGMGMAQPAAAVTFTVKKTGCTGDKARRTVMSAAGSLQTTTVGC